MGGPKPLPTKFGIDHAFESCEMFSVRYGLLEMNLFTEMLLFCNIFAPIVYRVYSFLNSFVHKIESFAGSS